jgi:anti-sigma factor RsiW
MNHRNFEDWYFSSQDPQSEKLDSDRLTELNLHLESCQSCQQLVTAWQDIDQAFQRSPDVLPETGFTNRWELRLEADRQRLQGRQVLLVLAFCLGAVVILSGSLFLLAWPWAKTPDLILWFWISRIFSVLSVAGGIRVSVGIILNTAASVIPPGGWILLVGFASELAVLWLVSIRLLTNPRRILI